MALQYSRVIPLRRLGTENRMSINRGVERGAEMKKDRDQGGDGLTTTFHIT